MASAAPTSTAATSATTTAATTTTTVPDPWAGIELAKEDAKLSDDDVGIACVIEVQDTNRNRVRARCQYSSITALHTPPAG